MGSTGTVLAIIGAVVVIGLFVLFQWQAHKKKIAEFTAFARQRGWRYTEHDRGLVNRFVVALSTPAPRPTLEVGREGLGRKLLGFVGVRDLQLESEEFNKTFLIRTEDDKFAYDVLHPRMMEWMLSDERALRTSFRFERGDLLTWDREKIDLPKVQWMLDYLCDVLDRVPGFVWKP